MRTRTTIAAGMLLALASASAAVAQQTGADRPPALPPPAPGVQSADPSETGGAARAYEQGELGVGVQHSGPAGDVLARPADPEVPTPQSPFRPGARAGDTAATSAKTAIGEGSLGEDEGETPTVVRRPAVPPAGGQTGSGDVSTVKPQLGSQPARPGASPYLLPDS